MEVDWRINARKVTLGEVIALLLGFHFLILQILPLYSALSEIFGGRLEI